MNGIVMNRTATKAMDDLIETSGMLTLAFSNLAPGARLAAMEDHLNSMQQRLSRVFALLTMNPDIVVEFEPGAAYKEPELQQMSELEEAVQFALPEVLNAHLTAKLHDGRQIARELEGAFNDRHLRVTWDAAKRCVEVNVTSLLEPLVEQIDPHGEDIPHYWDDEDDATDPD